MTHNELALALAESEGVENVFDLMVKEFIEASRNSSLQRMLSTPGLPPSQAVKHAQTLESAMEKIDHNLRSQYDEFLSCYVSTREAIFTSEQIEHFIVALREPVVQNYLAEIRRFRKELNRPITEVFKRMIERAMKGPGETEVGIRPV